jgi:hypothetical protein
MNMLFFHSIRKQDKTQSPKIETLDSIKGYFTVKYVQQRNDWYKLEFPEEDIPVKQCTQEDFGTTEEQKKLFAAWDGFVLVCPDLPEGKSLEFYNDAAAMISSSVAVKFEKCDPKKEKCADNMDEWLQDVQIDTWVVEDLINYLDYVERPTTSVMRRLNVRIFGETLINEVIPSQYMELAKHEFFMEDDWFQIGQITKEGSYFGIETSSYKPKLAKQYPGLLIDYQLMLTNTVKTHRRVIYDIVALLGDLGGVTEVIMLVMGIILFPISESSYNMMSTKRMFLASTADDELFVEPDEEVKKRKFISDQHIKGGIKAQLEEEIKKHRVIKLSRKDKLCYYL